MKRIASVLFLLALPMVLAGSTAAQEAVAPDVRTVTLYSTIEHGYFDGRSSIRFDRTGSARYGAPDLSYGHLRVGQEFDWLQVSTAAGSRTAIKEIGKKKWSDSIKVPVVKPFPILKEGQRRTVTVNASGRDGQNGSHGTSALGAENRAGAPDSLESIRDAFPDPKPVRSGPYVDPIFVRARVGHMYVVHVVNDTTDQYVLVRVDSLKRGSECTISWRVIPSPELR